MTSPFSAIVGYLAPRFAQAARWLFPAAPDSASLQPVPIRRDDERLRRRPGRQR